MAGPTEFPCDFDKCIGYWEQILIAELPDKIAQLVVRKADITGIIEPEAIYRGDRDADFFLDNIKQWVVVLAWDNMTNLEHLDQDKSIDDWDLAIAAALREDASQASDSHRRLMIYMQALREIIDKNLTLESVADLRDFETLKSVTLMNGAQLEDRVVGTDNFKVARYIVRHRISTGAF